MTFLSMAQRLLANERRVLCVLCMHYACFLHLGNQFASRVASQDAASAVLSAPWTQTAQRGCNAGPASGSSQLTCIFNDRCAVSLAAPAELPSASPCSSHSRSGDNSLFSYLCQNPPLSTDRGSIPFRDKIMSWSSGGLNSPSMASVLGSPAHADPTIQIASQEKGADRKRKNASHDQTKAPAQKRLKPKPMGRPRNGWTPTRKRKLVRLYLMTDLNVGEIAEVLRGKHFEPWYDALQ